MNVRGVGEYIRDQRTRAALSLSKLSGLAGVSIPYLSQIERGLRRPSADILQAIAKALRISAETLYVQAGILEARPLPDMEMAIMAAHNLTERHKQALLQIYQAFAVEAARARGTEPAEKETAPPQMVPVTVTIPVEVGAQVPPTRARRNGQGRKNTPAKSIGTKGSAHRRSRPAAGAKKKS